MKWHAKIARSIAKMRFRLLHHATIKDIATERFNEILIKLKSHGWKEVYQYSGFDAWVDYGCIKLRKGWRTLNLEWDNWSEGSIEGARQLVCRIAEEEGLAVSHKWRWSEYDEKKN